MGVAAASGPWWRSKGVNVDDSGGGLEGGQEGGPEPVFQRFSYDIFSSIVFVFGIVLFLYQEVT